MTISERLLRRWRKEALSFIEDVKDVEEAAPTLDLCEMVLRLTQELLDQHLLRK